MNSNITHEVYRNQADKLKDSSSSTMPDEIVRQREEELIMGVASFLNSSNKLRILDIGCGNGYMLETLSKKFPHHEYFGLDYTDKMVEICKSRNLNCVFKQGDVRRLEFEDNYFDFILTERCVTNVLDSDQQEQSLAEIHRILKPRGHYLFIECFTDGLQNNNKARAEFGLEPLSPVPHNLYFDKERFLKFVSDKFFVVPSGSDLNGYVFNQNFLSSHYFVARVLHPLLDKGPNLVRNSCFVKFFSFLPPMGNYSQIQAYLLRKL